MRRIEIVAAGAGTGKTHYLAELLETEIGAGRVRPEAVLATTFTNKAAAELRERVRTGLLHAGQAEAAHRLTAARMGTVNSVCGQLVVEHAFELGLPPRLLVLDENAAAAALAAALSMVVESDDAAQLADLEARMPDLEWKSAVRSLVATARTNGLDADALAVSAERSVQSFRRLFADPAAQAAELDRALVSALTAFVNGVNLEVDTTKTTRTALDVVRGALHAMTAGGEPSWADWVRLTNLAPGKKSDGLAEPVRTAAAAHVRHPRLHHDVERAIRVAFAVAAAALRAYAEWKRERGVLDFVDQETLALQLLAREDVQERLRDELDLVLVDEFQDTSPLQLEIFVRIASLAKRSVWVGDQKQAIFGFRGADPALMDAAVAAILGGNEPETLRHSWRSRPELVRLASDLFVPSLARHGLPESRVRLDPKFDEEPAGLGPIVERWTIDAKNRGGDADAIASGVRSLLGDGTARVRDRGDGAPRLPSPGDVAVLCLDNEMCRDVAAALANLGIPAILARSGLLATTEGSVVLAALRLWADPRDTLAAAQLARLVDFPSDGEAWLAAALRGPRAAEFLEAAAAKRLLAARAATPLVGVLQAFDLALAAVDARELCLRWSDSDQRLANLDALRSMAAWYVAACVDGGRGCSTAGLVANLLRRAAEEQDAQAVVEDGHAVVVSTWHRSKGLEWPITVLCQLGKARRSSALGVHAEGDGRPMAIDDPRAGRWIRYWPQPFHPQQKGSPFHAVLDGDPTTTAVRDRLEREDLRLLYVGWTRARDRVVLAERDGKLDAGILGLLADAGGPMVGEPEADGTATWAGKRLGVTLRMCAAQQAGERSLVPGEAPVAAGPRDHPAARVRPSRIPAPRDVLIGNPETIGPRLPLAGSPDITALGQAVHGFLATDDPRLPADERTTLAEGLLTRWGVRSAIAPGDVVAASDRLRAWVTSRWPEAEWLREWPLARKLDDGSELHGRADLLLRTSGGIVVIDHKTFPGRIGDALERARTHTGQALAYGEAVARADSCPALGAWMHFPTLGVVAPVGRAIASAVS